jgi:hypothetical protein
MYNNDPFKQIRQMSANARQANDRRALNRRIDESIAAGRRTTEATLRRVRDEADAQRRRRSSQRASPLGQENEAVPGSSGRGGHKSIAVFVLVLMILFGVFAAMVLLGIALFPH